LNKEVSVPKAHQDRKYRRGQRAKMAAQVHRVATAALRDLGSQLADIDERMRALMTAETLANLQLDRGAIDSYAHNERRTTLHAMLSGLSNTRGELAAQVADWRSIRRTIVNCPECRGKGQRWRQGILSGGTFVCPRCCGAGVLVAGVD
jgi:hypothetical protein